VLATLRFAASQSGCEHGQCIRESGKAVVVSDDEASRRIGSEQPAECLHLREHRRTSFAEECLLIERRDRVEDRLALVRLKVPRSFDVQARVVIEHELRAEFELEAAALEKHERRDRSGLTGKLLRQQPVHAAVDRDDRPRQA